MTRISLIILISALVVGSTLRLVNLGRVPSGFTWDEAAITYDAWGLSLDGHDQHGRYLPFTFESLGDYKAPGLIYLLAGIFKVFGLKIGAVRLISALAGIGLIAVTYFLAKVAFPKQPGVWPISAWIIAISPWNILMSRVGFEANVALTLMTLGVWSYLAYVKNKWFYCLSAISLILAFYTYQSERLLIPPIVAALMIRSKKIVWIWLIIISLAITPYFIGFTGVAGARARQTSIFFQNNHWHLNQTLISTLANNFLNHFTFGFLIQGNQPNLRQGIPGYGVLYPLDLVMLVMGTIMLINRRLGYWLWGMVLLGILPSVVGTPSPHAIRAAGALPFITLIIAYGINECRRRCRWLIIPLMVGYGWWAGNFAKTYFTEYALASAADFQYGYEAAVEAIEPYLNRVDQIYFTDAYGQPYIFVLLYSEIQPKEFLAGGLANYRFGPVATLQPEAGSIVVGTPWEISATDPRLFRTINYPNGTPVFRFLSIQ